MRYFPFLVMALVSTYSSPGRGLAQENQEAALREAALSFAQAWVDGEGGALEEKMDVGGIRLHLQGEDFVSIPPRQARASLRSFMERYEGGEAEIVRVAEMGGDPFQGFSEIRWGCRVSGTFEPVIFTLFVAYAWTETRWVVTEIRVLP